MSTKIQWTDETWNPIVGCSKVSEGCRNCYAERMAKRLKAMGKKQYQYAVDENGWTGRMYPATEQLLKPKSWGKPRRVFVCSMSDLFHENVPEAWIDNVMCIICENKLHTFQILTKRPERMADYFSSHPVPDNVWLGVTVENQEQADKRIPLLLKIPARVRFVSVEPMLGAVDLTRIKWAKIPVDPANYIYGAPAPDEMWSVRNALQSRPGDEYNKPLLGIDWVIAGGETGPNARPMHPDWARSLRDQCVEAGVPYFFKQCGEWEADCRQFISEINWINKAQSWLDKTDVCLDAKGKLLRMGIDFECAQYPVTIMHRVGKTAAGRELDGRTWEQFPEAEE